MRVGSTKSLGAILNGVAGLGEVEGRRSGIINAPLHHIEMDLTSS